MDVKSVCQPHQEALPTSPLGRVPTAVGPTPHHRCSRLFALSLSRPPVSPPSPSALPSSLSSPAAAVAICSANAFWSRDLFLRRALSFSSPPTRSGLTSSPQPGAPSCRHPQLCCPSVTRSASSQSSPRSGGGGHGSLWVVLHEAARLALQWEKGWKHRKKEVECGNALLKKGINLLQPPRTSFFSGGAHLLLLRRSGTSFFSAAADLRSRREAVTVRRRCQCLPPIRASPVLTYEPANNRVNLQQPSFTCDWY
ncbi:hypothetical protein PIB30_046129 [Stylosanthes scabra]|uniref:Uncharacterized protein n=1 Tax=Stylosanthes scabra TaxID=79078 RepID=A0ABU6QG01_9FABA|nr:hypothetical protein [Stylosanthes scabra]